MSTYSNTGNPTTILPARMPAAGLLSPSMADAISDQIDDVIGNKYSMDVVIRQYLGLSKFLLGDVTEANSIITPYLQAGFTFILAMHAYYIVTAEALTGRKTNEERDAAEEKRNKAFEEFLSKWESLFRTQFRPSLRKALEEWKYIQMSHVRSNGPDEKGYNDAFRPWLANGGTAPTFTEAEQSAFPWPFTS